MNIQEMIKSMIAAEIEKAIGSAMAEAFGTTESVSAEVKTPTPVATATKLSLEDFEEMEAAEGSSKVISSEFGCWRGVTKDGKPYVWCGWADPNTGKENFPGKQLYYVNDFYLKRDYGAYHRPKSRRYNFKQGYSMKAMATFPVRHEVDSKDAKEFIKYMQDKEAAKVSAVHDTPDTYANWCK